MDNQINAAEAKAHFSELLDRAASGEEIVIARSGKPVARLVPLEKRPKRQFGMFAHWPKVDAEALLAPMDEEDLRWAEGFYQDAIGITLSPAQIQRKRAAADRAAKKVQPRRSAKRK